MQDTIGQLLNSAGALYAVILLCILITGFFAVRNGRRTELTRFQKETIEAMQQRMDTLEGKISDLEKTNTVQQHIIDTITLALKKRGMVITIDGDMVTIEDKSGSSTHRRRTITTTQAVVKKEEE